MYVRTYSHLFNEYHIQHFIELPLERDNDGVLVLKQETVISGACSVIEEKSGGYICCAGHLAMKYKIASKEYDYDIKTWTDDCKELEYDGNIYRDIYIVPIVDAKCNCNHCDILKLLTPSKVRTVMKLADGNDAVQKYKLDRKEIAKRNKILDTEKVNRMRSISRGNRNRARFASLFDDDEGIQCILSSKATCLRSVFQN